MRPIRHLAVPLAFVVLTACSKKEPPPPERTEPWPASQSSTRAEAPSRIVKYVIDTSGTAKLRLKAKEATPTGRLRVARGELDVDLADLSRTRGSVSMDIASVVMDESEEQSSAQLSQQARNWLDVGSSRPEAERERLRWATFEITSIEDASASTPDDGKRVRLEPPDAGNDGGEPTDAAARPEGRAVTLKARGRLTLHGFRVEREIPLRVVFTWKGSPSSEEPPTAISIETRRAFPVALRAHDITARNAAGTPLAEDAKLIGVRVGREARVELSLSAHRAKK